MSKQMKLKRCLLSIDLNQPLRLRCFCIGVSCAVDAVEDLFADFSYLGLCGVHESAGRFVCEVWFVVL